VWRKKVSQQETGLLELYPNLLYFQGHKNRLGGFRNSICCSAGCNISGLGYSSQKVGHRLTFITKTYLYWTVWQTSTHVGKNHFLWYGYAHLVSTDYSSKGNECTFCNKNK
jgi:hypothetical protein